MPLGNRQYLGELTRSLINVEIAFMRVISMVPSWTETLLSIAKKEGEKRTFEVVGRTHFCIHPAPHIESIPAVGGTKNINWNLVRSLKADILILDREENPESMATESDIPVIDTHVVDLPSLQNAFEKLAASLQSPEIKNLAVRLQKIISLGPQNRQLDALKLMAADAKKGFQLGDFESTLDFSQPLRVNYLIWKDPWMTVAGSTFVGSMLRQLGFANRFESSEKKYPEISIDELKSGLNLFSTEPFPFAKKTDFLAEKQLRGILVDGEPLSWFGLRSLEFLELCASRLRI